MFADCQEGINFHASQLKQDFKTPKITYFSGIF